MKLFKTTLAVATALGATFAAMPAAAQVNGIAISNPEAVMLNSQARIAAYEAIDTANESLYQQMEAVQREMATLQQSLDTNSDNQLSDAEVQAQPSVVAQLEQKEQQIVQMAQPIARAQAYVLEQLLADYPNARNQVMQQKNVQMLLTPEVVQYAPDTADVTKDILAALNQRMPSVATQVPADWRASQTAVTLQQRMQQLIVGIAQRQAIAAAMQQQQQTAQPQAPAQPTGR